MGEDLKVEDEGLFRAGASDGDDGDVRLSGGARVIGSGVGDLLPPRVERRGRARAVLTVSDRLRLKKQLKCIFFNRLVYGL